MDEIADRMLIRDGVRPSHIAYGSDDDSWLATVSLAAAFSVSTSGHDELVPRHADETADVFTKRIKEFLERLVQDHSVGETIIVAHHKVIVEMHSIWYQKSAKLVPFWFDNEQVFALYG